MKEQEGKSGYLNHLKLLKDGKFEEAQKIEEKILEYIDFVTKDLKETAENLAKLDEIIKFFEENTFGGEKYTNLLNKTVWEIENSNFSNKKTLSQIFLAKKVHANMFLMFQTWAIDETKYLFEKMEKMDRKINKKVEADLAEFNTKITEKI